MPRERDMSKSNRYFNMKWIVCAYNGRFWEEIAAFNCVEAANPYAEACYNANVRFIAAYRVIERKTNRSHIEVKRWGVVS